MCKCVIILFDKTNYSSYLKAQKFIQIITSLKPTATPLHIEFLMNKTELQNENEIQDEEVQNYIIHQTPSYIKSNTSVTYYQISAITKHNFQKLINTLHSIYINAHSINKTYSNAFPQSVISFPSNDDNNNNNNTSYNSNNIYKIILLGDTTVGKTSFYHRFFLNEFTPNFTSTIGINESSKLICIKNKVFKIQIWDTAGQERFRSIPKKYYSKADGIILIYDTTKDETFDNIALWTKDIDEGVDDDSLKMYLVGNKIDLIGEKVISADNGRKVANEKGMKFVEVSCKWDLNINEVIYDILVDIYKENNGGRISNSIYVKDNNANDDENKKCCG